MATELEYGCQYFDHYAGCVFVVKSARYGADGIGFVVLDTGETVSEATFKSRIAGGRYEQLTTTSTPTRC